MSMTTGNMDQLTRSELWSAELKDTLKDELMGMKYVKMLDGFPDGDTFTIPSVGDARTDDYAEDTAVKYRPLDTGEYQFTISEYISSGHYITDKAKQDAYYASMVEAEFVPKQRRAIMEHFENKMFLAPDNTMAASANDQYSINGANHRFAGGNSGTIEMADFSYAGVALDLANVPYEGRVAIVPPQVAFHLENLTNAVNVTNLSPMWESIVQDRITTGMRFRFNIFGFDVYTSNYLPDSSKVNSVPAALPDRVGTGTVDFSTAGTGKPCYFFSSAPDVLPLVAAWRQEPRVEAKRNVDFQRDEYVTTARYGIQLYRPENMIICHSKIAMA